MRSRLVLEVASELVGAEWWPHPQVRVDLRTQGAGSWPVRLVASDGPDAMEEVLAGRTDLAILNPATAARPTLARLGASADAVAAIATVPSHDQLGLAVPASLGIRQLEELGTVRPRLRLSLRGQRNHAVHDVIHDVLAVVDVTLADIERWGGEVRYDDGLPHRGDRAAAIRSGAIDAVFDEGVYNWVPLAAEAGMSFVSIGSGALGVLEARGYRRARLSASRYPQIDRDVTTVDFSGFLVYVRADADDDLVRRLCTALHARRDRIAWQGGAGLPLDRMVRDEVDAPLPVALHPAAARFWREVGVLHA